MFGELATCGGNAKDLALLRADSFVKHLDQGCSKPWALVVAGYSRMEVLEIRGVHCQR